MRKMDGLMSGGIRRDERIRGVGRMERFVRCRGWSDETESTKAWGSKNEKLR